ncbi:M1 family metallopeptidase [Fulvivirga ligni]|uniref:M1 family metallopeptidase n=1 Tax=Fulvivirga ligni TaxID=2904246 RepID=UPI001F49134B|nr:M1 family aminopeptidase [Fulvivirga ligni]UII19276.1 M1 family aminopeptidase [Fulvivirga ligni]
MHHKHFLQYAFLLLTLCVVGCKPSNKELKEKGISQELAADRRQRVSNINYKLEFQIPENTQDSIQASEELSFDFTGGEDLLLDFNVDPRLLKSVTINDAEVKTKVFDEHIALRARDLKEGRNTVNIEFVAGEQSLNRHDDYLYTLFVPERASTCFPLFDQPDLKAVYDLTLRVPKGWKAVANGSLKKKEEAGERTTYQFNSSPLISSYLFSFAVGDFQVVSREVGGRKMNMYHRETDTVKLANNLDAIFDWHQKSIAWLEDYTEIKYPFEKFDFVLVPSFQYGGMEHPGAILYKASSMLLDESATLNEQMGRGQLIAHETAHMWFGDLVTMKWFDDVWLKEVFANFMASKIVNPGFPDINHDLQFLMSHYPAAYDVDRTEGTHPIQQPLDNLKNAGTLYGSIIYHKAPVVMLMLEQAMGEEAFQNGLRQYLKTYSFSNATWDDLIAIMAKDADFDIEQWNKNWVKTGGMPSTYFYLKSKDKSSIDKFSLYTRVDHVNNKDDGWRQDLKVLMANQDSIYYTEANMLTAPESLNLTGNPYPQYVFTNGGGLGYGYFKFGPQTKDWLISKLDSLENPVLRGAVWIDLYESMLRAEVNPKNLMEKCLQSLLTEQEPLIVAYITNVAQEIYWKFYTENQRLDLAPQLEGVLLNLALSSPSSNLKSTFFHALTSVALTDQGVDLLRNLWSKETEIEGLTLSERDYTSLAYALAVREVDGYKDILQEQQERISNPDRKNKFKFVLPALSADTAVRRDFFNSLKEEKNRQNEDWVLTAISYLHHPLRADYSVQFIKPSLDMLEEIQLTGDIFFPQRWLGGTLGGHSSAEAAEQVQVFFSSYRKYPSRLRNKILQSSDKLFRAVKVKKKYSESETDEISEVLLPLSE